MLAAEYYIHFYFNDYAKNNDFSNIDSFIANKISSVINGYKNEMQNRWLATESKINKDTLEKMNSTISGLIDDEKQREDIVNSFNNFMKTSDEKTVNDSIADIGAEKIRNYSDIASLESTIDKIIDTFQKSLSNAMDKIIKKIDSSKTWANYSGAVIDAYIKGKKLSSNNNNELQNSIIQDLLSEDSFIKTLTIAESDKINKNLDSVLQQIAGIAASIKILGEQKIYKINGEDKRNYEVFQLIAKKLAGLSNILQGYVGELATAKALEGARDKVIELNDELIINIEMVGNKHINKNTGIFITPEIKKDPDLKKKNNKQNNITSKSDILLTITENEVSLTYGITVKNYKVKPGRKSDRFCLTKTANLFTGLNNIGVFDDEKFSKYFYNVAAGHDKENKYNLNQKWKQICQLSAFGQFLEVLAGSGKETQRITHAVLNGHVLSIGEVLDYIGPNFSNNTLVTVNGVLKGGRSGITENIWVMLDENINTKDRAKTVRSSLTTADVDYYINHKKFKIFMTIKRSIYGQKIKR